MRCWLLRRMGKLFVVLLAGVYSKEYEKKAEQSRAALARKRKGLKETIGAWAIIIDREKQGKVWLKCVVGEWYDIIFYMLSYFERVEWFEDRSDMGVFGTVYKVCHAPRERDSRKCGSLWQREGQVSCGVTIFTFRLFIIHFKPEIDSDV